MGRAELSERRTAYALYLKNFYSFSLSSLKGVSLSASSALKLYKIFLKYKVEGFKKRKFRYKTKKIQE